MQALILYISTMIDRPGEIAALFAAAALASSVTLLRTLRPWQSYLHRRPLLTTNEREFFFRLTRALPNHSIFTQVSFSALIAVEGPLSDRKRFAIRRRYAWKYADFVVCAPYTLDVLVLVELDDRTHDAASDRKRDTITKAAGYQTLRFQSRNKPTVAELSELFARLLPTLTIKS